MTADRKDRLLIGLGIAAAILIGRLFVIQIIDTSYKIDASNNSMVYQTIYPTRGIIHDRNGKILVGNKITYDLIVTPKEVGEFDTLALCRVLGISEEFLREKMEDYYRNRRKIGYRSVVMLKQLSPETYLKFAEVAYRFPGFRGQERSVREYPFNAGGNLLGYVSEVDQKYIDRHKGEYTAGDYAGMTGIEAAREKELRGEKGYAIFLRNSHNKIESRYRNGEMDKEAIPGNDITATIDADLQKYGQMLMQNKVGSLVAIEPSTGEILTLVSSPGIDVDVLADFGSHYSDILNDPYKLDLEESIMMSCNAYYCYVFRSILENGKYASIGEALDKWDEYVRSFGFGRKLGSDFPAELGGTIPDAAYYDKVYGDGAWKATTVISLSIGQGEIGCTPLHLANLCSTIANRGYYYIPHIIKDSGNVTIDSKYREKQFTLVDTSYFPVVVEGMYRAVNSGYGSGGTATVAAVKGLDICGKTGTAQNPRGDDNSVFICFAPKDNPKIAVAAYVEHGSFGARWAAPIASLLVEKYLSGEISSSRKYLETRVLEGNLMDKVKPE